MRLKMKEGEYVFKEIHERICENHSNGKALAQKTLRQGYYWPTKNKDVVSFVKKYDRCQKIADISKRHPKKLSSLYGLWSFA